MVGVNGAVDTTYTGPAGLPPTRSVPVTGPPGKAAESMASAPLPSSK